MDLRWTVWCLLQSVKTESVHIDDEKRNECWLMMESGNWSWLAMVCSMKRTGSWCYISDRWANFDWATDVGWEGRWLDAFSDGWLVRNSTENKWIDGAIAEGIPRWNRAHSNWRWLNNWVCRYKEKNKNPIWYERWMELYCKWEAVAVVDIYGVWFWVRQGETRVWIGRRLEDWTNS